MDRAIAALHTAWLGTTGIASSRTPSFLASASREAIDAIGALLLCQAGLDRVQLLPQLGPPAHADEARQRELDGPLPDRGDLILQQLGQPNHRLVGQPEMPTQYPVGDRPTVRVPDRLELRQAAPRVDRPLGD